VVLRIRVSGKFSTWTGSEERFRAFDVNPIDTINFIDGAYVIGVDFFDINTSGVQLDLFAEGINADWILENGITLGTVFEGRFKLCYESIRLQQENRIVGMAALVLIEGIMVVGTDSNYLAKLRDNNVNIDDIDAAISNQY